MVRTVYVDLLFLINFSMDFLAFFVLSRLFLRRMAYGRAILASAFGGVYAVLTLFLPLHGFYLLLSDAAVCMAMCAIFSVRKGDAVRDVFGEMLAFTGISMAMGGIMTAAYTFLGKIGIPEMIPEGEEGLSPWLFFILAVIGSGATLLGGDMFGKRRVTKQCYAKVTLFCRCQRFRAVVDTGNALRDPITGIPAAVLSVKAAERLMPEIFPEARTLSPGECLSRLPEAYRARARLLPAKTVTGEGLLLAFRPERFELEEQDSEARSYELLLVIAPMEHDEAEILLPPGIYG